MHDSLDPFRPTKWCRHVFHDPPPNPPLVRGGAWRSLTLCDGKCPPRHKFSTGILGFFVLRIWYRKAWGFESPSPHYNLASSVPL
jgi:hypothetical protein